MSSIKLDLSKVKHIKSDERSTTLRHSDGHTIHLLHSALSPENQTQLQALSKIAPQAAQAVDKNMAKGGEARQNYAFGTHEVANKVRQVGSQFATATGVQNGMEQNPKPAATSQSQTSEDSNDNTEVRTPEQQDKAAHNYDTPAVLQPRQEFQPNMAPPGLAKGGEVDSWSGQGSPANPISRPNTGSGAIIAKAKGGVCHACGGTMMAEGGKPPANLDPNSAGRPTVPDYQNPVTADQQPTQQQLPDPQSQALPKAQPDDKSAQMAAYSKLVKEGAGYSAFGAAKGVELPSEHLPGPNGEAPTGGYDVKAWQNAQNDVANAKEDNAAQIAGAQQQAIQQNQIRASLGQPPLPIPNVPNGPQIPGSEENPPANTTNPIDPSGQKAITGTAAGTDPMDPYSMLQSGYQQQLEGIQGTSTAQQDLAKQQATILQNAQKSKADALAQYQTDYAALDKERKDHISDIQNGYVDPNKYWTGDAQGNGSHSKLAAGIGMILAGFNPTNKPNAAIEFLKYNMDKNMEAQAKNLGAKESMLSANLRQFGNLHDARTMTQLMQSDMIQNDLGQAAATAATPMAKAAALTAKGQLQQQDAPMFQQFAMRRAMMNLANNPNGTNDGAMQHMIGLMRAVDPKTAETMSKSYVPGVGYSPTQEIPQSVRDQLVAGQTLQNSAADVLNYSKTHTNLVPGTPEYNIGVQKAAILQQRIREGLLGTVFRESEKPLLQQFVDDNPAGAFKQLSTQPKLKAILDANTMQMNILKSNYDLPVNRQSIPDGQTIINKSTGQRMQMVNGKWTPVK